MIAVSGLISVPLEVCGRSWLLEFLSLGLAASETVSGVQTAPRGLRLLVCSSLRALKSSKRSPK